MTDTIIIDGDINVEISANSLKYESGTYTPSSTNDAFTRPFKLAHDEAPFCVNGSTISSTYDGTLRNIFSYDSNSKYVCRYAYGSTGYGVFSDTFYPDGSIRFRARYNSNYSRTIDGTYSVEVYLLDPPTNAPIFT